MDKKAPSIRLLLGGALLLASLCAGPGTAHASGTPDPTLGLFSSTECAAVLLSTSAIAFGSLDLLYFGVDRPMPTGLAIVQMVIAGALVPMIAARRDDAGLQIGAAISSAWFLGHGIYSASAYSEYRRQRQRAIAAERTRRAMDCPCAYRDGPSGPLCRAP